jgi:hypothetical protein
VTDKKASNRNTALSAHPAISSSLCQEHQRRVTYKLHSVNTV